MLNLKILFLNSPCRLMKKANGQKNMAAAAKALASPKVPIALPFISGSTKNEVKSKKNKLTGKSNLESLSKFSFELISESTIKCQSRNIP